MDFKFELGCTVRDTITGFKGVVVNRTQWLNNCNVYGVQPRELKDGKIQDKGHFDEPQIELVLMEAPVASTRKTGGPERPISATNR